MEGNLSLCSSLGISACGGMHMRFFRVGAPTLLGCISILFPCLCFIGVILIKNNFTHQKKFVGPVYSSSFWNSYITDIISKIRSSNLLCVLASLSVLTYELVFFLSGSLHES